MFSKISLKVSKRAIVGTSLVGGFILTLFTFVNTSRTPPHVVDTRHVYGEFYIKGNSLIGMVCSSFLDPEVKVGGTRYDKVMFRQRDSKFRRENRHFAQNCTRNKKALSYYSIRVNGGISGSTRVEIEKRPNQFFELNPKRLRKSKKVGILYHTWHCPYGKGRPASQVHIQEKIKNKILNGQGGVGSNIGPLRWPHWKANPFENYNRYCLSDSPDGDYLVKKHAAQLVNAGIDYLYLDLTNAPRAYDSNGNLSSEFRDKYHDPIMNMITEYQSLLADGHKPPQLALWIGTTNFYKGDTLPRENRVAKWILNEYLPRAQNLNVKLKNSKPTLFVKVNKGKYTWNRVAASLEANYNSKSLNDEFYIQPMWAHVNSIRQADLGSLKRNHVWSYLEKCRKTNGQIMKDCGQRRASRQISVAPYYQAGHALSRRSVHRRKGRTFYQQFNHAIRRNINNVSISGWNAWVTKRLCNRHRDDNRGLVNGFLAGLAPKQPYGELPYANYGFHNNSNHNSESKGYGCNVGERTKWSVRHQGRDFPMFLDFFGYNHSRDMEPDRKYKDCNYQLMRELILDLKTDRNYLSRRVKSRFENGFCRFNLRR